jgi:hypothetical protein
VGWRLKGGHDHAKQQQRRQPDRQLVGRNELDDGSGGDRTGPCVAIRLITRTRPVLSGFCDALLNSRDPLLPIRIGEEHLQAASSTRLDPSRSRERAVPGLRSGAKGVFVFAGPSVASRWLRGVGNVRCREGNCIIRKCKGHASGVLHARADGHRHSRRGLWCPRELHRAGSAK